MTSDMKWNSSSPCSLEGPWPSWTLCEFSGSPNFFRGELSWSWSILMASEGPWTRTCSLPEIRVLCKTKKVEVAKHLRRPGIICSQWRCFDWWDVSQSSLSLAAPAPTKAYQARRSITEMKDEQLPSCTKLRDWQRVWGWVQTILRDILVYASQKKIKSYFINIKMVKSFLGIIDD